MSIEMAIILAGIISCVMVFLLLCFMDWHYSKYIDKEEDNVLKKKQAYFSYNTIRDSY